MPTRLSPSSFYGVRRLLSCTKGCSDRQFGQAPLKLKLENNKDRYNSFKWLYTHIPFSCFSWGFYKAYDTCTIALMVNSCLFCDDDCHKGENQALVRGSTPSSLLGLGNHTKQNPLTGVICWLLSKSLDHVVDYAFTFVNVVDCAQQLVDIDFQA